MGGTQKKNALYCLFSNIRTHKILLQESSVSRDKAREALSPLLVGWNICTMDANSLFGGLILTWNPTVENFNGFISSVGLLIKGIVKDFINPNKSLNFHGPYSWRKEFWLDFSEEVLFRYLSLIITGGLNLTLSMR